MSELFGERLRRLRLAQGLSVQDVADRLHVTHSIIGRAEMGTQQIRAFRLPILARIYKCSIDYIMTGREPPQLAALHHAIRIRTPYDRLAAMVPPRD